MTLKEFLNTAKQNLETGKISHIVTGNKSADLDSIISAILLSYAYENTGKTNAIPLINIPKKDYKLRTESYGLLKQYDIDEKDLIFFDDIPAGVISNPENIKITVVDHNKLPDNLRAWDNNVEAVFDHHKDIGEYKNANPRIFSNCGSCSSLIAQYIFDNKPEMFNDEMIAILNISPILVDTVNLDKEQGRVTDFDIEIAEKLKPYLSVDLNKLYEQLQQMKTDVSALSSEDLLRKDYKQWNTAKQYGMSSVPLSIEDWLEKDENFAEATDKYIDENNLDFLVIMTAFVKDGFNRELIVTAKNDEFAKKLSDFLNTKGLDLVEYQKEIPSFKYKLYSFTQKALAFSRKKVQPFIEEFLQ